LPTHLQQPGERGGAKGIFLEEGDEDDPPSLRVPRDKSEDFRIARNTEGRNVDVPFSNVLAV
jgi:hypothetical protein